MVKEIKKFPRSVLLFHNEAKPEARRALLEVKKVLNRKRIKFSSAKAGKIPGISSFDLAIAVGGDGTMLKVARVVAPYSIPLLGVNAGGLGFLAAVRPSEFAQSLESLINGRFHVQERWMFTVSASKNGKSFFGPHLALNDCVIRCADQARAIVLRAQLSGKLLADYFGDGLIISTPTGSTAYSLAASGPLIDPSLEALIVSPICPHALTQRPLVLGAAETVSVRLISRHKYDVPRVLMSVDGQLGAAFTLGSEVTIERYERPLQLLAPAGWSYYDVLRQKLKWGIR
jgi:NAD+ kinase